MSQVAADYVENVETTTTAHNMSERQKSLLDGFITERNEKWKSDLEEDMKVRDMFKDMGKRQAEQAVGKAEAFLYNKETEGQILDAIIGNQEEVLYTKNELRDMMAAIMADKTPLTEEEVKQLQDEEDARRLAVLDKENGKF
jgi:hypothetical protein